MRRFLLVLTFIFSVPAHAQQPATPTPDMPAFLLDHKARGAQVFYLGKFDTLDGWTMIREGQPEFYYATPGNNALVMGLLFDGNGELQTADQLKNLSLGSESGLVDMMASKMEPVAPPAAAPVTPAPAPVAPAPAAAVTPPAADTLPPVAAAPGALPPLADTPAAKMYAEVQGGSSLTWGQPKPNMIYAFIDPNCPHCQRFLIEMEPLVNSGQVSVQVLPVGYNDQSLRQASFVLGAGDGMARLVAYAKGAKDQLPDAAGLSTDAAERNLTLMRTWGFNATPFIVYRHGTTGEVRLVRGEPGSVAALVRDVNGQ